MEHKSGSLYYVIPAQIMDDHNLSHAEKLLYGLIRGLADDKGKCFAGNEWFSKKIGESERTIQRYLENLEKNNYITREIISCPSNPFKKYRFIYVSCEFKKCLRHVTGDTIGNVARDTIATSPVSCIISEDNILISEDKTSEVQAPSDPPPPKQTSQESKDISRQIFESVRAIHPKYKEPNFRSWEETLDLMIRRDGRTWDEIRLMLKWVYENDFWGKVIQSAASLREHWDKMAIQRSSASYKAVSFASSPEWIHKVKERVKNHNEISFGNDVIAFTSGQSYITMKLIDKESILSRLKLMKISTEGL